MCKNSSLFGKGHLLVRCNKAGICQFMRSKELAALSSCWQFDLLFINSKCIWPWCIMYLYLMCDIWHFLAAPTAKIAYGGFGLI
jgi:hypothetical protein